MRYMLALVLAASACTARSASYVGEGEPDMLPAVASSGGDLAGAPDMLTASSPDMTPTASSPDMTPTVPGPDMTPPACGGRGQPCCPGNACNDPDVPSICMVYVDGSGPDPSNGKTVCMSSYNISNPGCGSWGGPCCGANESAGTGDYCRASEVAAENLFCTYGKCQKCPFASCG